MPTFDSKVLGLKIRLPYFVRQRLSLNLGLADSAVLAIQKVPRICLPNTRITSRTQRLGEGQPKAPPTMPSSTVLSVQTGFEGTLTDQKHFKFPKLKTQF